MRGPLPAFIALAAFVAVTHFHVEAQPLSGNAKVGSATPPMLSYYNGAGTSANALQDRDSVVFRFTTPLRGVDKAGFPLADSTILHHINAAGTALELNFLQTHKYDAQNRDTLLSEFAYESGAWIGRDQVHHYMNPAGQDTLMVIAGFSAQTNSFEALARTHYVHDALGDTLFTLGERLTNGVWEASSRMTGTYTATGKPLVIQKETRSAGVWSGVSRNTYTYTAGGQLLTWLYENYSGGAWKAVSRTTHSYDGAGRDTGVIQEQFTTASGIWKNIWRNSYTYDIIGNVTADISWRWDATAGSWLVSGRKIYSYNPANQQTNYLFQIASGNPVTKLINYDSSMYAYDAAGNMIKRLSFHADTAGSWLPAERSTYTFTATHKTATQLDEKYNNATAAFTNVQRFGSFYNAFDQQTRIYKQQWINGAWAYASQSYESRYHYDTDTTGALGIHGATGLQAEDLHLYPVPADDRLEMLINFDQPRQFCAAITDMTGRTVMSWNGESRGIYKYSIATSGLISGCYHISIQTGQGIVSRTFSVQH